MSLSKLSDCLAALVADKALSQEQADDVQKLAASQAQKFATEMAWTEAEKKAAMQALAKKVAETRRSKALAAKEALILKEVVGKATQHPDGLQAGFLAFLTKDWHGRAGYDSVEYRAGSLSSMYDKAALALFEQYKPQKLGLVEQVPGLRQVVREVFGEESGDAQAKAAAKAWKTVSEKARKDFNRAGGDIGQLDSWHLPQHHDEIRVEKAGFDAWRRTVDELKVEIFDEAGNALAGAERADVLKSVFDSISTGGLNKLTPGSTGQGKKLANRRADHRVLNFPNADSWLAYHERFGTGSLYSVFAGHLQSMARDVAALEILGPNPVRTMRVMRDLAEKSEKGSGRAIERTWQAWSATSEVAHGWRRYLYAGMQGTRNLLRSAQMGSATLSAVSDLATVKATADWNGLSASRVMADYVKYLNPADASHREMARASGLVAEASLAAMRNSRVVDEDLGKGLTGRLANLTFEASGLNAHTRALRSAFGLETQRSLAERAGKKWSELEPAFRGMLERGGMDERLWTVARHRHMAGGSEDSAFMDTLGLALSDNKLEREAGLRLHSALLQETDMAVPQPDARVRGMMNLGTKGNTLIGEIVRTVGMYRSYPVTVTLTHGMRAMSQPTAKGKLGYAVPLMASMTVLGMFALQSKQISSGKDPRDMIDWKTWGQAAFQGGGLGILGDFMGAALSRTDKDLASVLAGTGYGLVSDIINLTSRNAMAEAQGKDSNSADDLVRFLQRYTPGSNLWYAKLATDRLFWSQLREMADPEAVQSFARAERRALKDYGQQYWWRPGSASPDRAPDLSAAFGDNSP